jgi:Rieske Fe-S protein
MPLDDDLKLPLTEAEMHRRKFLGLLGAGALAVATVGTGITAIRFLEPNVLFEEDRRYVIGKPEEIPIGTVLVLSKQRIYLMRTTEGFFALSSVCTHLGCMTTYDPVHERLACPCHGSRFSLSGQVAEGPAPRPLPRLLLTVERGLLVVDAAQRIAPDAILKVA